MRLPNLYHSAPLDPEARGGLAIGLVFRGAADAGGGHLVDLRACADARVLLGCLKDAAGTIHEWLELWIQDVPGMRRALGPDRALPNLALDQRFLAMARAAERMAPAQILRTGHEEAPPVLLFLDPVSKSVVTSTPRGGAEPWRLCRDDRALTEAGLPGYSTSVHRYACAKGSDDRLLVVPLSAEAPASDRTLDRAELAAPGLLALNPEGGSIAVRRFAPLGFGEYLDALSGTPWLGLAHARAKIPAAVFATDAEARDDDGGLACDGALFAAQHAKAGRLLESFYLRLRALADCFDGVRQATALTQRPLLNLREDSFRVRVGEAARSLPLAWTSRTALVDFGDALEVAVPGSDARLFTRLLDAGASVYWPESAGGSHASGRGSVRVRRSLTDATSGSIVEGTLTTAERLATAPTDLMWLRLPLATGPVDLYASAESEAALASGEWRFRTLGQRLAPPVVEALRQGEGITLRDVPFRVIPVMSSPCDLYSLGVLGVRALLVGHGNTLAMALDETLSLARQLATDYDPNVSVTLRLQGIMDGDERWAETLGPQRMGPEGLSPAEAFDAIPPELWRETLALIVRMFPGVGPDSQCRDLGDAPAAGLHVIYDGFASGFDSLLLRARSLLFMDWKYNREIGGLLRRRLMGAPKGA